MRNRISKWSRLYTSGLCLVLLCGSITSCHEDYKLDEEKPHWLTASIYSKLEQDGNFKTYLRLLEDKDVNTAGATSWSQILGKTGSKTIFASNDEGWNRFFEENAKLAPTNPWSTATSYEKLTPSQKKLLLHTSMLNNAIVMEDLASNSGSTDRDPVRGKWMRRITDVALTDSVARYTPETLPVSYNNEELNTTGHTDLDYWSDYRDRDTTYVIQDGTPSMMLTFTNEHMANNGITDDDFRIFMNAEEGRKTNDVYIYNVHLDSADITCENGYLNITRMPLRPLPNMAEVIRINGKTNIFSHMLDRFSILYPNATVTETYHTLYESFTDSIYNKRYFSSKSAGNTTLDNNHLNSALFGGDGLSLLSYDPGWNQYYGSGSVNEDMGAMFVPDDESLKEFFLDKDGQGYNLIQEYYKMQPGEELVEEKLLTYIDQIPLGAIQKIINEIMFPSFCASVPSKMLSLRNSAQEPMFTESDKLEIRECQLACNGAVYIMSKTYLPADYSSVASPAFIKQGTTNKVMYWAIYDGSTGTSDHMGLNYYAYLKAMKSRFSFFLPTDKAMLHYYDPMSFGSATPRLVRFMYKKSANDAVPFYLDRNSERTYTQANYNIDNGTIGTDITYQSLSENEIITRLRDVLESHTIVHSDQDANINKEKDEYYLTKNGTAFKVERELVMNRQGNLEPQVVRAYGGFQLENLRKGIQSTEPGICQVNVEQYTNAENGSSFEIDAPIIPASRSVYSIMSNCPRNNRDMMDEESPYYQFLLLCSGADDEVITGCGLVNDSLYTNSPADQNKKMIALKKYKTFVADNGLDYNVQFFKNYNYTVLVPTNDRVIEAYNNGLPSWESIRQDFEDHSTYNEEEQKLILNSAADSLRIKTKITFLTNFIRYHFADNSIFADQSRLEKDLTTQSFDNERGLFNKIHIARGDGKLFVNDKSGGQPIGLGEEYNIMTRDYVCTKNPYNITAMDLMSISISGSSYAVVHQIDGVLNHEPLVNGKYRNFDNQESNARYLKRFAIR